AIHDDGDMLRDRLPLAEAKPCQLPLALRLTRTRAAVKHHAGHLQPMPNPSLTHHSHSHPSPVSYASWSAAGRLAGSAARSHGSCWSAAPLPTYTARTSCSLAPPTVSTSLIYLSVSFCRRSVPRFSSSAEISFFFSWSRRWSCASRRMLRTATRASSIFLWTTLTKSLRRSSVSGGVTRRIAVPTLSRVRTTARFSRPSPISRSPPFPPLWLRGRCRAGAR